MKISIFGLGYVGAVSMACLARDGHQVVGVDIDDSKLELIRNGQSPVIEAGMPALMAEVAASGRVKVSRDVGYALAHSEISFICVGTPSQANGDQDQSAILRLTEQLGVALRDKTDHHTLVYRSTLIPGTVEQILIPMLESLVGKPVGDGYGVCFQPEFLREGSSIKDYDHPPFTIIGGACEQAQAQLEALFGDLPGEFYRTDIATAETVKYFCNIFHAVKITFANEVARLCEGLRVDPHQVMALLCRDTSLNISPAYLRPGFAFGGSCLPKDLRAMHYQAKHHDVHIPMLSHVLRSNEAHLEHAIHKVLARRERTGQRQVVLIGLSFKPGTDDLRESPLVGLAEQLLGKGMLLSIYDPNVSLSRLIGANKRYIEHAIPHIGELMVDDLDQAIRHCDTIVVGQNNPQALDVLRRAASADQLVIDLIHLPELQQLTSEYQGLAW